MNTIFIVEFNAYMDKYASFDKALIANYRSRYYENELYEYTYCYESSYRFRRIFDCKRKAVEFIENFFNSVSCKDDTFVTLQDFKNGIIFNFNKSGKSWDFYDGFINMELSMTTVETTAKKIKKIIYED